MKIKNIAICVLLSCLTCGIYYLCWIWSITEDVNFLCNKKKSPTLAAFLTLITCGLYSIYWTFKMSFYLREITRIDNIMLNEFFTIFGMQIVSTSLIQKQINEIHRTSSERKLFI